MPYKRHSDDEYFDQIFLIEEGSKEPIIRMTVVPRYKTSDMSGDEWRISAATHIYQTREWKALGRNRLNLEAATLALYPTIYGYPDLRGLHNISIASVDFYRKGFKVYESTYEGKPLPLLHVAGHLPWAFITAREEMVDQQNWNDYCFQPGCSNKAVSTYTLKYEYCWQGHQTKPLSGPSQRCFCQRHLQRGNAGLEDADDNYIVAKGPGPAQAKGWEEDESPAVFGGVIDLTKIGVTKPNPTKNRKQ